MYNPETIFRLPGQEPKKAESQAPAWIGAGSGVASLIVTMLLGALNLPWLKWVAIGLAALAILILAGLAWAKWVRPVFVRRRATVFWRSKVSSLPDFIQKFLKEVAGDNYTDSILYNVRSIPASPNGENLAIAELIHEASFLRELAESVLERFIERPPRVLSEIKLSFSIADKIVRRFGDLYGVWRKWLMAHWHQLSEHSQTGMVKSSAIYLKFVDDYSNYRRAGIPSAYELGGFYIPTPDPLPGLTPKVPKA